MIAKSVVTRARRIGGRFLGSPLVLVLICASLITTGCGAPKDAATERLDLSPGLMIQSLAAGFASDSPHLYCCVPQASDGNWSYCQLGTLAWHLGFGGNGRLADPGLDDVDLWDRSSDGRTLRLWNSVRTQVCLLSSRGWEIQEHKPGTYLNDDNLVACRTLYDPDRPSRRRIWFPGGNSLPVGYYSLDYGCRFVYTTNGNSLQIWRIDPSGPQLVDTRRNDSMTGTTPRVFVNGNRLYAIINKQERLLWLRAYTVTDGSLILDGESPIDIGQVASSYGMAEVIDYSPWSDQVLIVNSLDWNPDEYVVYDITAKSLKKLDRKHPMPIAYLSTDLFAWNPEALDDIEIPFGP